MHRVGITFIDARPIVISDILLLDFALRGKATEKRLKFRAQSIVHGAMLSSIDDTGSGYIGRGTHLVVEMIRAKYANPVEQKIFDSQDLHVGVEQS